MPRKSDAKTRMIDAASVLFRAKGYNAVGLTEILEASGAPKGSFYHHFPDGKEELARAVIQNANTYILHLIEKSFQGAESIQEAAGVFLELIASTLERSGFRLGCPVTAFIIELTPENEAIRLQVESVLEGWVQAMISHSKKFQNDEADNLEPTFRIFLMAIEGSWIIARAKKSIEPILMTKLVLEKSSTS